MIDAGATLGRIRESKPLVHNITNYVVMNETRTRSSRSARCR